MLLRKRIITALVVTALSAVAVAGAVGVPSVLAIQDLHGQINDAQVAIDQRVAMFRYLRKAAADLTTAQKRIAALSEVAVHEGHELEFITTMEDLATKTGVEQELNLNTVNQKDISGWERLIPVSLSVKGTYPQVRDYLTGLERLPYLVSVSDLAISRFSDDEAAVSSVAAQLNATIYWIGAGGPDFTRPVTK